jgi:hypothetical protein
MKLTKYAAITGIVAVAIAMTTSETVLISVFI